MDHSRQQLPVFKVNNLFAVVNIAFYFLISACHTPKPPAAAPIVMVTDTANADTNTTLLPYQATPKKTWDILNTKLDVSFDWTNCYLLGKATINLKPHFYPSNITEIDAVGFTLNDVSIINGNIKTLLKYTYDGKIIKIQLPRQYNNNESLNLFIDYVSKPNQLKTKGSEAITSDKGLYFINPTGKESNKPQQIWTQGETQASSCWFPTIDAPNQKMTQEISITVDKKFKTLSNGLLIWQQLNADSTRTDVWKQSLPAPPYLTMMTIGDFTETKDQWNNIEVSYLVEKQYGQYAKQIFGNTPEMLSFFSKTFGVNYPWEKYAQVVVRDYVSGAMENASATLLGEFMLKTDRELIDETNEDYIAHELTHQWFGDLVTCESWSNLTLNEGFATYGEYLWLYHKYGKDEAERHLLNDLNSYLNEAKSKQVDLIRFGYDDKEDMFDSHSYNKGGRVLHMLRNLVGENAFFASIKLYLEKNKFKNVEAHDLRMAFEEVTGLDLNYFFNQWFFASGHPNLKITYSYNDTIKKQFVKVEQMQDLTYTPLYRLPLRFDFYTKTKCDTHYVELTDKMKTFEFEVAYKPDFIVFDPEKILLCEKSENKTTNEWIAQYNLTNLYTSRIDALINLEEKAKENNVAEVFAKALSDKSAPIREFALDACREAATEYSSLFKSTIAKMVLKDEKSKVRAAAIDALSHAYNDKDLVNIYKRAIDDLSYAVEAEALKALYKNDKELGFEFARTFETDSVSSIVLALCNIYSLEGEETDNEYFIKAESWLHGGEKYDYCKSYSTFLLNKSDSTINKALPIFERIATSENAWYIRLAGFNGLELLKDLYSSKRKESEDNIKELELRKVKQAEINKQQKELDKVSLQLARISSMLRLIKSLETDKNLLGIYNKNN